MAILAPVLPSLVLRLLAIRRRRRQLGKRRRIASGPRETDEAQIDDTHSQQRYTPGRDPWRISSAALKEEGTHNA